MDSFSQAVTCPSLASRPIPGVASTLCSLTLVALAPPGKFGFGAAIAAAGLASKAAGLFIATSFLTSFVLDGTREVEELGIGFQEGPRELVPGLLAALIREKACFRPCKLDMMCSTLEGPTWAVAGVRFAGDPAPVGFVACSQKDGG